MRTTVKPSIHVEFAHRITLPSGVRSLHPSHNSNDEETPTNITATKQRALIITIVGRRSFSQKVQKNSRPRKKKISNAINYALKTGAKYFCAVGDDELTSKSVSIKNLKTREEQKVSFESICDFLKKDENENS